MARHVKEVVPEVEVPLELAAEDEVAPSVTLSRDDVVEVWKALTALVHDAQAQSNHKTRVETAQYAMPALEDALGQLGYGVRDGVLVPPGCHLDEKTGQLVHPEA